MCIPVVFLLLFLSACGAEVLEPQDLIGGSEEFVWESSDLQDQLYSSEDGGYVLPPVANANPGSTRAGFMFDAAETPEVYVRVSVDGGESFADWQKATISFVEKPAHNAHADIAPDATHLQIRFDGVSLDKLQFVFAEIFTFSKESTEGDDVSFDESAMPAMSRQAYLTGVDVTRAQWGARATRATSRHTPYRIAIHHTATPNNDSLSMPARMRQMQNYHMDTLGWGDLGYHFCVGQDGKVYQGRPEHLLGAHVGNHNSGNIGISFIGNYHTAVPSTAMMNAGAKIIRAVANYYKIGINRTNIRGHREFSGHTSNACPGQYLYSRLNTLVSMAAGSTTPSTGVLRGVIYHGTSTSNGISGATVRLNTGQSVTTDSNGNYSFTVAPGTYTVTASRSGYNTASLSRSVTAGQTTWGSIRLTAAVVNGVLRGVIYHSGNTNNRVAGATVRLNTGQTTTADSSGNYSFTLAPGTYTVTASASGYSTVSLSRTVSSGTTAWGSINLTKVVPGVLRGVIYHSGNTNNRVAGATVRLNTGQTTTSDSSGNYSFSLAPGTYTVTASRSGYRSASISRTVTSNTTIWGSINLTRL